MRHRLELLLCLLVPIAASCGGGGDDPSGPGEPAIPRVLYSPEPGDLILAALDSVVLSVEVVPENPFTVEFTLGDSVVCEEPQHLVVGDQLGRRHYTATVIVDELETGKVYYYDDSWDISIVVEVETPTPPPGAVQAGPGTVPGSIRIRWDRPPDREIEIPLEGYEVAWSDSPFLAEEFELQEISFVADDPGNIRQSGQIEGLGEREQYYVRVRSVDVVGRNSEPTGEYAPVSTGSFTITGTVSQLDESGWPVPVGSVAVEAGPRLVTTIGDGVFALSGLPDLEPLVLRAEEGSGLYTLPVLTHALEPVDRTLDLVLVPRQNVDVYRDGSWSSATYREFLLDATGHGEGLPPYDFRPWQNYPVKVWVWEFVSESGDQPSYHDGFRRAIDLWNGGATGDRRLFEYVAVADSLFDPTLDPSSEGVFVRLYQNTTPVNLGEVVFVRPENGRITEDDPQLLKVMLRRTLNTQYLVDRVVAHELGHTLGLGHTMSETNLMHMSADRAAGVPTPEELFVARFLRHGGPSMRADWIVDR